MDGDIYSIPKSDFMIAFTLEHSLHGVKDDTRYIQWVIDEHKVTGTGDYEDKWHSTHRCTDEEFKRFYPVE